MKNYLEENFGTENFIELPVVQNTKSECAKCMRPYDPDCEICNGTGSFKVIKDTVSDIAMLHCKYGCNSLKDCKGWCDKNN